MCGTVRNNVPGTMSRVSYPLGKALIHQNGNETKLKSVQIIPDSLAIFAVPKGI